MIYELIIRHEAAIEIIDAVRYYEKQQVGLVKRFLMHLETYFDNNNYKHSGYRWKNYERFNSNSNYTDHLGNIRLQYAKVEEQDELKIMEEDHYYPFGLKHARYNQSQLIFMRKPINDKKTTKMAYAERTYKYKYNGKELQDEFGLNVYDYGARMYDPATARWYSVDPLASKYPSISGYAAFNNNPILYVDPDGRENIPALIWAAKNMANKGIPFGTWYGGNGGWTFKKDKVPTETVCYESCWTSYMNGADANTMQTLKTGFSSKRGGFKGRSHDTGGMNWFKEGDGKDRQFVTDISKGELGDIVFMGEVGDMSGHAVLLASDITTGTTTIDGKEVNTMSFYVLTTSSETDSGNYGGELITWTQQENGEWTGSHGGYTFRGYGQMTNVNTTDEQRQEATKLIEEVKKGN